MMILGGFKIDGFLPVSISMSIPSSSGYYILISVERGGADYYDSLVSAGVWEPLPRF